MIVLSSRVSSGHLMLVRLPDGASFTAHYADDHSTRDITAAAADLLLSGALDFLERAEAGQPPAPQETVDVAEVSYLEPLPAPGVQRPPASFSLIDTRSAQACDVDPARVMGLLVAGMAVEVTAAVAAQESGSIPDDPAELDGTTGPGEGGPGADDSTPAGSGPAGPAADR